MTLHGTEGNPQPPAQRVTISNGSPIPFSYSVSFANTGAAWAPLLSKASGSLSANGQDTLEVRPPANLPAGDYHGFLQFTFATADGPQRKSVAVSLFQRTNDTSKVHSLVDAPMTALFRQPNGNFEASTLEVTNVSASPVTYTPQAGAGYSFSPERMVVAPGQSGTFAVQAAATQSSPGFWIRVCIPVLVIHANGRWEEVMKCFWVWNGPNPPTGGAAAAACTPSSLQPVITGLAPQVARLGHPLDITIQAYDNYGQPVADFTARASVSGGGETHIAAVGSTGRKAVTKKGSQGFSAPGDKNGGPLIAVADDIPQLDLSGKVYPYFYYQQEKGDLTLKVEVDAPNPFGDSPLTGSVETPLPYDFDPRAPLAAEGSMVSNITFERVAMAPFEVCPGARRNTISGRAIFHWMAGSSSMAHQGWPL